MLILLIGASVAIIYLFRSLIDERKNIISAQIKDKQLAYDQIFTEDCNLQQKIYALETQASDIFALYEITKDISKTLKEQEAFEIFKDKIKTYIEFQDLKFTDIQPNQQESKDYSILPLKSRQKEIGFLAIKGLSEPQQEMFSVLTQQFSLGLNRIRLYENIEQLAITDSLTKLFTRRHCLGRFQEELERALKYKMNLSFLMIDIDNFKFYNDKFGHLVGDAILKEVASVIKSNVREIDLVGRYGGEEFSVILTDTPKQGALFLAERIREAVRNKEIKAYDERLNVTISIGIATCPDDAKSSEELLDKADWCLYRAKKMGKNQVCVYGQYEK
jgi:diguanylate cyclase (GGDEF)-like protein